MARHGRNPQGPDDPLLSGSWGSSGGLRTAPIVLTFYILDFNFGCRYSYGLSRAQVLGGLVNGIFLLSVTFMMLIEVIMKLVHLDELKELEGHVRHYSSPVSLS